MADHYSTALSRRTAVLAAIAPDLDTSPGSDLYDELQADASGSAIVMYALDAVANQSFSGTATGDNLDNLAADAGLRRLAPTFAAITVTVSGASAGPSGGWPVPQGTRVYTTADANGRSVYFTTDSSATVPVSGTATINCTATLAGSSGNVVANGITQMDDTPGVTLTSSTAPATPASDRETDTALRARINATRTILYSAAAVEAAALAVPGCAYADLDDPHDGSGHTTLYAAAQDGTLSAPLQALVQAAVDAVLPLTATNTVDAFTLVRAVFRDTIAVLPGYTANVVAANVVNAIAAYVLTLGAGQTRQPGPMWAYVTANVAGLADWYSTSALPTVAATQLLRLLPAPASPVLGTAATGGALSDGTIYCQITWDTAAGETLPSVETSIVLAAGTSTQTVTVPIPAFPDASVTQANVYLSSTVGGERLQGDFATSAGGTYTQTGALATGSAAPPTGNTVSLPTVTVAAT